MKDKIDAIIEQLKAQLSSGQLNPGDRIPAERKLAADLGVSRTHVRTALRKLEYYGILKTIPQSGTFVIGLDTSALEGLIQGALSVTDYDLYSLAESRLLLETHIIRLSCRRRTEQDLARIEESVNRYEEKIATGIPAVEEDLGFHRQIAEASKNQVLKAMMLIITPDLMRSYRKFWSVESSPKRSVAAMEHRLLLEHIRNRDEEAAAAMIDQHLRRIVAYARSKSAVPVETSG
ncbi:MAG: FadR family transcriptional regulator [Dysgonamonadaceae bacterium]|jgi:GntR family transcriptional repressor for pyruvate dehydrogenase complex|nr:FadR family transcriptional regulator [Dysgonamonadaceae bacterium]